MASETSQPQKICFVVMGFGEKTDFQTQRVLDLDKTYRIIIRKAVEDAGLKCIRADDVIHSGMIDKPMYELLLSADVVVADLSTSNANAIYELGVRHALRPNTTIVIAESQFKFPFDVTHLAIRKYEHLGKGIDAEEADRIRDELCKAIRTLADVSQLDSPVYTFLPQLKPPVLAKTLAVGGADKAGELDVPVDETVTLLLDAFRKAKASSDFISAQAYLSRLLERRPKDPYVIQQLALATYKTRLPTPKDALLKARDVLRALQPHATQDTETLGLWGSIHKGLWDFTQDRKNLDEAIWAYERGFYLRNDYYTGINYAFLLNVRAGICERAEAITDFVTAERVRRRLIDVCKALAEEGVKDDAGNADTEATFWVYATLIEAYTGIGDRESADAAREKAKQLQPWEWMLVTMNNQLTKLDALLQRRASLGI
jgi:tetratricopeptide (TPR) repeat protein